MRDFKGKCELIKATALKHGIPLAWIADLVGLALAAQADRWLIADAWRRDWPKLDGVVAKRDSYCITRTFNVGPRVFVEPALICNQPTANGLFAFYISISPADDQNIPLYISDEWFVLHDWLLEQI